MMIEKLAADNGAVFSLELRCKPLYQFIMVCLGQVIVRVRVAIRHRIPTYSGSTVMATRNGAGFSTAETKSMEEISTSGSSFSHVYLIRRVCSP